MCVIITKSKNQDKPSKEFLEKAWKPIKNMDGFGKKCLTFRISCGIIYRYSRAYLRPDDKRR